VGNPDDRQISCKICGESFVMVAPNQTDNVNGLIRTATSDFSDVRGAILNDEIVANAPELLR
jgi:hypothetical protein